jgi:Putative zinc-finger/HEAT repeats
MNCEQVRELFPDYLAGPIESASQADIDAHLAGCGECRDELSGLQTVWTRLGALPEEEPSRGSEARFHAMLEAYRQGMKLAQREGAPRVTLAEWLGRLWPRQPALQFETALLLFALGLLIGSSLLRRQAADLAIGGPNERTLAQLREEVSTMRRMVTLALLQEQSPSDRLLGVQWSYQLRRPGEQVLSALLRALDSDPNVNVRLAAVDALHQFASEALVRKGLLRSLAEQKSPLVQIELINLMVRLSAKESVPLLKELSQKPELDPSVRERVEWGLQKLG